MFCFEAANAYWNNKKIYKSLGEIKKAIEHEENFIILFVLPEDDDENGVPTQNWHKQYDSGLFDRNIICIDKDGVCIWEIPLALNIHSFSRTRYVDFFKDKRGRFWAYDGGFKYNFDPKTGEIMETIFTK